MTLQTAAPVTRLNLAAYNRNVRHYVVSREHIDVNPPYQRASVWSLRQRQSLIYSLASGTPIPGVIINDRMAGFTDKETSPYSNPGVLEYGVVDGKQRIETVQMFFDSEFAVPASWFEDKEVETTETTDDGEYVRYDGLTAFGQRSTLMWTLPSHEAQLPSIEEEARLFLLVNGGGVAQTDEDTARAAAVAGGNH